MFGERAADKACGEAEKKSFHGVQEQCIGTLVALCLRFPEGAARCGGEGCFDAVIDAMSAVGRGAPLALLAFSCFFSIFLRGLHSAPLVPPARLFGDV